MKASGGRTADDISAREEKRRIFEEISAYRKAHGIGCFKKISEATGGKVAAYTISHMLMGTRLHNEIWLQVGEALKALRNQ